MVNEFRSLVGLLVTSVALSGCFGKSANKVSGDADPAYFATWHCETFGPQSTGHQIVVKIDGDGWRLMGENPNLMPNPFGHQTARTGRVVEIETQDIAGFIELNLEGLNSSPPSGKWVSYTDGGQLGWISWGGEGSENLCNKVG